MNTITYQLQLSNSTIDVFIERKKIRNFYLKISPDSKVVVSMPLFMGMDKIYEFLHAKKVWIEKNIKKFQTIQVSSIKDDISNGGTVKILDSQYIVFIYESKENKITIDGFNIYIYSKKYQNLKYVEKQYNEYLQEIAKDYFEKVIDKYYPILSKYNISRPSLKVKKMKSKWGSCVPRANHITLNLYLFKASIDCLEYVVFHELTHLLYHGHKKNFYNFLEKHMPNYRVVEKKLDFEASKLLLP